MIGFYRKIKTKKLIDVFHNLGMIMMGSVFDDDRHTGQLKVERLSENETRINLFDTGSTSIEEPTKEELSHHYLWRFWKNFPKTGHIAIFDRSWYGRVMVEAVEGFCTQREYDRAFFEINDMEKHLVGSGITVIKFFLHISKDEQLKRFEDRRENPHKAWKLTDEDFRNREKWDDYLCTIEKMIDKKENRLAAVFSYENVLGKRRLCSLLW